MWQVLRSSIATAPDKYHHTNWACQAIHRRLTTTASLAPDGTILPHQHCSCHLLLLQLCRHKPAARPSNHGACQDLLHLYRMYLPSFPHPQVATRRSSPNSSDRPLRTALRHSATPGRQAHLRTSDTRQLSSLMARPTPGPSPFCFCFLLLLFRQSPPGCHGARMHG